MTAICTTLCLLLLLASSNVFGAHNRNLPIYRVSLPENDRRISVTFDNAWGADDIPDILSSLEKYNAKATFFILGTWAEKFPETVRKIYDAGHEIANHSYAHYKPTKLDKTELLNEITKCNDAIKNVTGQDCVIYRTPYGDYNDFVVETAKNAGMHVIQWDVDSLDWKEDMSKDAIFQRVTARTKSGSIILFHNDTKYTKDVLPLILEKLTSDGFTSVPISELIYKEQYFINAQGEQHKK